MLWYGNISRRCNEAHIQRITNWKPEESQPSGRPNDEGKKVTRIYRQRSKNVMEIICVFGD